LSAPQIAPSSAAIERAGAGDIDVVLPLFQAYLTFYRRKASDEDARNFLSERLKGDESVIFVARDASGAAVGFTQLYPLFSSTELSRIWLLNDLYVAPSARRGGVALALLHRAEAHARETGATRLMLDTAIGNRTAQRVYENAGWVRDHEFYVYVRTIRPNPP
jgi:GNAT superfamily N-acetyltransferase